MPKEKLLYGTAEVAEMLGVDQKSIRKAMEAGEIPCTRIGRLMKVPVWWINKQRAGGPDIRTAV